MHYLQKAFCLAKKVGKGLGGSKILQQKMQTK
jgi:hypothetical protein